MTLEKNLHSSPAMMQLQMKYAKQCHAYSNTRSFWDSENEGIFGLNWSNVSQSLISQSSFGQRNSQRIRLSCASAYVHW